MTATGKNPPLLYLSVFLSAIGGFLFGYDTGVVSGAMPLVEKQGDFLGKTKKVQDDWHAAIVATTVAFAFLFSFVGGWMSNRFGRRPAILFSSLVFTVGAITMGASPNRESLLVGRIILGMGIGVASMCVPVYMAETSPENIRGFLTSSFQVMICFGQVTAGVTDALFGKMGDGWKYDFGLAAIPSVILLVGFFFCPESPRLLVQKGKTEEALEVLKKIRPEGSDVQKELQDIISVCEEDKKIEKEGGGNPFKRMLKEPVVAKALVVGCTLQLFQQLSGINTVIYYAATIIMMSGISDDVYIVLWINAGITAVNFFASFIGQALCDRVGRRLLTLCSFTGLCISLIIIGLGLHISKINSPEINSRVNASSECSQFTNCYDCTYQYDSNKNGEDLNCGFCFTKSNSSGYASCAAWEKNDDDNNVATEGWCEPNDQGDLEDGLKFVSQFCPTKYSPMILIGLAAYLVSFQAGLGVVPWVVNSEIYPLWFRSAGVSMATAFNWLLNVAVSEGFPYLVQALDFGSFYLFAGFSILAIIWFYLVLPETKGKSLEEMPRLFSKPMLRLGRG